MILPIHLGIWLVKSDREAGREILNAGKLNLAIN